MTFTFIQGHRGKGESFLSIVSQSSWLIKLKFGMLSGHVGLDNVSSHLFSWAGLKFKGDNLISEKGGGVLFGFIVYLFVRFVCVCVFFCVF